MKKEPFKKMIKQFEDIMAASAFAEGGMFDTAREVLKGKKKILLTLTGRDSDTKSFKYAVNICKRIDAELQILQVNKNSSDLLGQFQNDLKKEGIHYELIHGVGCIKEVIVEHTDKRRDVLFVIIGIQPDQDVDCAKNEKTIAETWKRLKCPLVVVSHTEALSLA